MNSIPGHCGIAMLWRKSISQYIKVIKCESDRIIAVEIVGAMNGDSLFIIGVYLPQQQCKISSFDEQMVILGKVVMECKERGEVVITGDMNCHFSALEGDRFGGVSTKNAKMLRNLMNACKLEIVDSHKDAMDHATPFTLMVWAPLILTTVWLLERDQEE